MANGDYKIIPSVYLILERDGKVLMSRRFNTGWMDGHYGLGAAGHGEPDETFKEGIIREALEEAGIELSADSIEHVLTMHRHCGDHQRADFFFTASDFRGEPTIAEPHLCDDMQWFDMNQLPENTIPQIRHALECYQNGIRYTEFNWPEQRNSGRVRHDRSEAKETTGIEPVTC